MAVDVPKTRDKMLNSILLRWDVLQLLQSISRAKLKSLYGLFFNESVY